MTLHVMQQHCSAGMCHTRPCTASSGPQGAVAQPPRAPAHLYPGLPLRTMKALTWPLSLLRAQMMAMSHQGALPIQRCRDERARRVSVWCTPMPACGPWTSLAGKGKYHPPAPPRPASAHLAAVEHPAALHAARGGLQRRGVASVGRLSQRPAAHLAAGTQVPRWQGAGQRLEGRNRQRAPCTYSLQHARQGPSPQTLSSPPSQPTSPGLTGSCPCRAAAPASAPRCPAGPLQVGKAGMKGQRSGCWAKGNTAGWPSN